MLCAPVAVPALRGLLRAETGTLGVRMTLAERWPAAREVDSVVIDGQLIRIKASAARAKAEHDDVAAAARRTGRPLREVAFRAEAAYAEAAARFRGPRRERAGHVVDEADRDGDEPA